jgi:hypothetical protein
LRIQQVAVVEVLEDVKTSRQFGSPGGATIHVDEVMVSPSDSQAAQSAL